MDFWSRFWSEVLQSTWVEWTGFIFSLLYTTLAILEKRVAWIAAFLGSVMYIVIGLEAKLYVDGVLNFFYAILAVMGWLQWKKQTDGALELRMETIPRHLIYFLLIGIGGISLGFVLEKYTDQQFPYLDSLVFFASCIATWLTTKKIVENWYYFVIIDAAMVYVYYSRGYVLTATLFSIYTLLALWGSIKWRLEWKQQRNA